MTGMEHRTTAELLAGLALIEASPPDAGPLELIVRRPSVGEREVLDVAELRTDEGLVGDCWLARGSSSSPDGAAVPGRQLTIMNARAIALFAGDRSRWPLAGDQLYVDLDLSDDNLPPGTRLELGEATIEMSPEPHTGCAKFLERFGRDVSRFINGPEGMRLHLRGRNARVIASGKIRTGDQVSKSEFRHRVV
jgi:hypothetical protein